MLDAPAVGVPDGGQKFVGSFFIVEAESVEAVKEYVQKDPYWFSGKVVRRLCKSELMQILTWRPKWDLEKVAIHPIFWVIGQPS